MSLLGLRTQRLAGDIPDVALELHGPPDSDLWFFHWLGAQGNALSVEGQGRL